ncbi:hypothetical protein E3N88_21386 [Mikania micrantha]|uniref:Auxin-responsive protein n=1 Tax=Mikania micrantha TaxID=192012 RepID=A0A5N6NLJ6_9ASTR|nr:hypothetical protein E3N88_21386 [Mikania micrantha]
MKGVPIGRKVDLNAYDTYEKLSVAVDQLFRGLLAAQNDTSGARIYGNYEDEKPITGLLDGNGEYTLVYEDNEGETGCLCIALMDQNTHADTDGTAVSLMCLAHLTMKP